MEWRKIKNIIILILLCVNLCLLTLVVERENKSTRYQEELRAGVLSALERGGVAFLPDKIPPDLTLQPIKVVRSRDGEQKMAEALLGPVVRTDTGGNIRMVYAGDGGTASFSSDGSFEFALNDRACVPTDKDLEKAGKACLEALGLEGILAEIEEDGGDTRLLFRQMWDGIPLFSVKIVLTYRDGILRAIEGERLEGNAAPEEGVPLDTMTILVRFLAGMKEAGYVCSRIDGMQAGYLSKVSTVRPVVELTPAWCVATDTGWYYVDALTGTLSLAE